jgi:two-component system cell cycle response regulator DivK
MLVVEDNDLAGTTVCTLFETMGFDVTLIANGLQVMPYLQKNVPDVVILDLELPGMTGDQIYKAMKDDPSLANVPIVPFTAHHNAPHEKLTNNLVLTAYMKTRVIPDIVYKTSDSGEQVDINKQLIDEVAYVLVNANRDVTPEMAKWYMETRNIKPEKFMKR